MNTLRIALFGTIFALLLAPEQGLAQRRGDSSGRAATNSNWLNDYKQAKVAAQKSGKPLMVIFRCNL